MTSMAVGSVARMLHDMPPAVQLDDPGQEGTVTIPALLNLLERNSLHTQLPLVNSWNQWTPGCMSLTMPSAVT